MKHTETDVWNAWNRVFPKFHYGHHKNEAEVISDALEELFELRRISQEMGDSWKVAAESLKNRVEAERLNLRRPADIMPRNTGEYKRQVKE